jgi:hypothetical protein
MVVRRRKETSSEGCRTRISRSTCAILKHSPAIVVALLLLSPSRSLPQDLFESQVYNSETVAPSEWDLETHLLYISRGTTTTEATVLPTNRSTHLSFELTRGISDVFELGSYLLLAQPNNGSPEYAGFRLRPRVRAPEQWNVPVGLSLSVELGFPRPRYEANSITLELRPIIDKQVGAWTFALNPVVGRALRGPDAGEGFEFEPSAGISREVVASVLSIGLEYYGAMGPVGDFKPAAEQVHFLRPDAEIAFGRNALVNLGVVFGLTNAAERLMLTCRLGYIF